MQGWGLSLSGLEYWVRVQPLPQKHPHLGLQGLGHRELWVLRAPQGPGGPRETEQPRVKPGRRVGQAPESWEIRWDSTPRAPSILLRSSQPSRNHFGVGAGRIVGGAKQAQGWVPTSRASLRRGWVCTGSRARRERGVELWRLPELQDPPSGPRGPSGLLTFPGPPGSGCHQSRPLHLLPPPTPRPRPGPVSGRPVLGAWRYLLRQLPPPSSNLSSTPGSF